jgi:hypothetical protein
MVNNVRGMNGTASCISLLPAAASTHPGCATLAAPLFAFGGKRVKKIKKSSLYSKYRGDCLAKPRQHE